MKNIKNTIELFQTSSFRVTNPEKFLANNSVNRITNTMQYYGLSYRLSDDCFAFSLPPDALCIAAFEGDINKVDRYDLVDVAEAIENHIIEGCVCKMMYVEAKAGEYLSVYNNLIELNKSGCEKSGIGNIEQPVIIGNGLSENHWLNNVLAPMQPMLAAAAEEAKSPEMIARKERRKQEILRSQGLLT